MKEGDLVTATTLPGEDETAKQVTGVLQLWDTPFGTNHVVGGFPVDPKTIKAAVP